MDFTGYSNFPFPSSLPEKDRAVKDYFHSLPDDLQLKLLNSSKSYNQFFELVSQHRQHTGLGALHTRSRTFSSHTGKGARG